MHEKIRLKDGRQVIIRELSKKDSPKELADFINEFVKEDAFLVINKKKTIIEEKKWLKGQVQAVRKGLVIALVAEHNGKIVCSCDARKGREREADIIELGICISKPFRGVGLGERILRLLIKEVKRKFNPRMICLSYYSRNKPAKRLYTKIGFRPFAVFRKWAKHKGKWSDRVFMKL